MDRIQIYFLLVIVLTCWFSCKNGEQTNEQSANSIQPFVEFKAIPNEWKPGDSVRIFLTPKWDAEDVELAQAQFSFRANLGNIQTIKYGINSEVLIVPQFYQNDLKENSPDVEIVSSYSFPQKGNSIFLKEHYDIVEARQGYYSFQKDFLYHQLDTISAN